MAAMDHSKRNSTVSSSFATPRFKELGPFPEEIWIEILNHVNDSRDILNVLKAIPQLDRACQKRKADWLIDQVLPHLMTKHLVFARERGSKFVDSTQLYNLRLVSRRWKLAVESCIQNQADRQTLNTYGNSIPFCLPKNHFNNYSLKRFYFGANVFRTQKDISEFLTAMQNFEGNPFPGRYVRFEPEDELDPEFVFLPFLKAVLDLLQNFGHHIYFLDLFLCEEEFWPLDTYKEILSGMSHLKNLKSLKIWGFLDVIFEESNEFFSRPENLSIFPKLENLESFDFQVDTFSEKCLWLDQICNLYGRKGIEERQKLSCLALWIKNLITGSSRGLENLTELHLYLDDDKVYDCGDIRNVLNFFPKGRLKTFHLSENPNHDHNIDELIEIIAEFDIQNVGFENYKLKEKAVQNTTDCRGIISLQLDDSKYLTYEFLNRLPDLRILNIYVDSGMLNYLEHSNVDLNTFSFKFREYFWHIEKDYKRIWDDDFDIWNVLPSLQQLTVGILKDFSLVHVQFLKEYGNKPFFGQNAPVVRHEGDKDGSI